MLVICRYSCLGDPAQTGVLQERSPIIHKLKEVTVVITVLWLWLLAASALGLFVQHALTQLNVWKDPFGTVKDSFQAGQGLCERWCETCNTLTSFWKRYSPHPWKGSQYAPESLNQFAKRLDEVHSYI